jgi:hypothetical protein
MREAVRVGGSPVLEPADTLIPDDVGIALFGGSDFVVSTVGMQRYRGSHCAGRNYPNRCIDCRSVLSGASLSESVSPSTSRRSIGFGTLWTEQKCRSRLV